jgi:hypothetical protein
VVSREALMQRLKTFNANQQARVLVELPDHSRWVFQLGESTGTLKPHGAIQWPWVEGLNVAVFEPERQGGFYRIKDSAGALRFLAKYAVEFSPIRVR